MPQPPKPDSLEDARQAPAPENTGRRATVVDVLRGLVMVLMPLDHTREFFTSYSGNPLDPQHTTLLLYLTRWITHLCAPVFVFLAGTSIFLQQQRKIRSHLTQHLLARGLWLIIVELTLVHLVFNFHWQWNIQILEVIWAIGASMMVMAVLIHLRLRWVLLIGGCLVGGHNLLDGVTPASFGRFGWLWQLMHVPGLISGQSMNPPIILLAYPLLPWVGVMAVGYAFGKVLVQPKEKRRQWNLRAGLTLLVAFGLLRWTNLYGDPVRWSSQPTGWRTWLSFMNVQKYPPSLLFLLVTLGIAALIAAGIESAEQRGAWGWLRSVLQVYGRVPFFYYLLHIPLIHVTALIVNFFRTGAIHQEWYAYAPFTSIPEESRWSLALLYLVFVIDAIILYVACRWYVSYKFSHHEKKWLRFV